MSQSAWNSLEISKLFVALATPLMVAFATYQIQMTIQTQAQQEHATERLLNMRLNVYQEIQPSLNRIFCYVEDIGGWKSETPESITAIRREVSSKMYVTQAVWPSETFSLYRRYIDEVAFKTWNGVGVDALIRTTALQKSQLPNWTPAFADRLTNEVSGEHRSTYGLLQAAFARAIGVSDIPDSFTTGR